MGTSSANWRDIVHRSAGAVAGISARLHFGDYNIDTVETPEISRSDALTIQSAAAQSDSATVSAVLASGWATWWGNTATTLSNAGAPAGTLVTACRDWFNNVTF